MTTKYTLKQAITHELGATDAIYEATLSDGNITGKFWSVHANCGEKFEITYEKILPYRGAYTSHGIVEKHYDGNFLRLLREMGGEIGSGEGQREEMFETMEYFWYKNGGVQCEELRSDLWEIADHAENNGNPGFLSHN